MPTPLDFFECYADEDFTLAFDFGVPHDGVVPTVFSNNSSFLDVELDEDGAIHGMPRNEGTVTFGVRANLQQGPDQPFAPMSKEWTVRIKPRSGDAVQARDFKAFLKIDPALLVAKGDATPAQLGMVSAAVRKKVDDDAAAAKLAAGAPA